MPPSAGRMVDAEVRFLRKLFPVSGQELGFEPVVALCSRCPLLVLSGSLNAVDGACARGRRAQPTTAGAAPGVERAIWRERRSGSMRARAVAGWRRCMR